MPNIPNTDNRESEHDRVFGQSFARFDAELMADFVRPFARRFVANDVDPTTVFGGRRCLDAGCGTGRGALFMAGAGAASVDAVDVSSKNVATTVRNFSDFGVAHGKAVRASIERLPYEDEHFDVVWCYGVIQHTANPDACLKELARVLRPDGQAFIFVYGSGGLYWYVIRRLRRLLAAFDADTCFDALKQMGWGVYDLTTFMDDWKSAYLRCYTRAEFETRLQDLGFVLTVPFRFGEAHDLNHRRNTYRDDIPWVGDGDLRYLLTKSGAPAGNFCPISDSEFGSEIPSEPQIESRFGTLFDDLECATRKRPHQAVQTAAAIHKALLKMSAAAGPLDLDQFRDAVAKAALALDRTD